MNIIISLIAFTLFSAPSPSSEEIDSTADQLKVETAVVQWADSSFVNHSNYKFEQFKAFYTDEYYIQTMRLTLYQEKIDGLIEKKENGLYSGTEEDYQNSINKLNKALKNAKENKGEFDRVEYYQIHFWSNIQTRGGITVYYELNLKLDNDYQLIEALENSSIGKLKTKTKIAYKRKVELVRVIEK